MKKISRKSKKDKEIVINVRSFPPLVVVGKDNKYSGFEIDLWNEIAKELDLKIKYLRNDNLSEMIDLVVKKKVDVGSSGITVTEEREKIVDFSHVYFESGLRILVSQQHKWSLKALRSIFTVEVLKIFLGVMGLILIAGNLFWYLERGSDSINAQYFPGVFEAFWWAIVTLTTVGYGDIFPLTWEGKLFGSILILTGISVFGLYMAKLSSSMTLRELKCSITNHDDLEEKDVGTIKGSTSELALHKINANVVGFDQSSDAVDALLEGKLDAVVYDSPILLEYAKNMSQEVKIVGDLFEQQHYGWMFPIKSKLRKDVNIALLTLRENGVYDELYFKWFGDHPD